MPSSPIVGSSPTLTSAPRPHRPRISSRTRLFTPNDGTNPGDKMSTGRTRAGDGGSGSNGTLLFSLKGLNPWSSGWTPTQRRRLAVFLGSVVVGLASGSNYVYSAYAPQLATQLVVSSTTGNLIGLAGNLGVYLTGPLWGKIVDARGQRIPLLLGGLCCLIGYSTVHAFYVGSISLRSPSSSWDSAPTTIRLSILLFAMFLTGCGGSSGLTSGVNAVAKSFPDSTRASATGTVLAGFGLSAFLFSSLGHLVFKGDAGGLLVLLAAGTGIPMLLGSLYIAPVHPEQDIAADGYHRVAVASGEEGEADDIRYGQGQGQGQGHAANHQVEILIEEAGAYEIGDGDGIMSRSNSLELTRSRSPMARGRHTHSNSHHDEGGHRHSNLHAHFPEEANIDEEHGHNHSHSNAKPSHNRSSSLASIPPTLLAHTPLDLFRSIDFWILFAVLALLCGVGLMYINNAGTVALALGRQGMREYDKEKVAGYQARQVGLVSIWNCAGRIIGGVVSDFGKSKYHISRIWFLPLVCVLFTISQLSALETTHVQSLWAVSSLLGLAYGSLFNVLPMLVLEWFGMKHFSQNWGWTAVAPIIGSNAFNLLFGRVYDAHTIGRIGTSIPVESEDGDSLNTDSGAVSVLIKLIKRGGGAIPDDGKHDCIVGVQCYSTAFQVTFVSTIIALFLSVWAGVRRERYSKERRRVILAGRAEPASDSDEDHV